MVRPPVTASAPHDPPTGFPTASRPTGAGGERRSRRRRRRRSSDSESDSSRAWGARSSSSSRSRSPRARSGLDRCMSPGGQTVVSMWGRDAKDRGLEPNPFSLQEWRRARRHPENPPLIGERNPYGDWSKIRTKHLLKRYGCREKAPAFCPPEPDYVLVGAFNDVARDKDTKAPYKRCPRHALLDGAHLPSQRTVGGHA